MFPEGTRTPRGSQGTYKSGGTRLAVATGAPVRADRRDLGALLAAQELHAAAGRDRRLDRPADPVDRPRGRRADARGRDLDRGRDAAPRPRGLSPRADCPARWRASRDLRAACAAAADPAQSLRCSRQPDQPTLDAAASAGGRRTAAPLPRRSPDRFPPPAAEREIRFDEHARRLRVPARAPAQHRLRRRRRRPGGQRAALGRPARGRGRAAREGALDPAQAARAATSARAGSQPPRIDWRDGTSIPFLGEPVIVVLDPRGDRRRVLNTDATALPGVPRLHAARRPAAAARRRRRSATRCRAGCSARRGACSRSAARHFAPQLGVRWTRLSLSSAQHALGQRQRRRLDPAATGA